MGIDVIVCAIILSDALNLKYHYVQNVKDMSVYMVTHKGNSGNDLMPLLMGHNAGKVRYI